MCLLANNQLRLGSFIIELYRKILPHNYKKTKEVVMKKRKDKPSYEQIYLAYSRCFVYSGDGSYYVGNHRLCDTFSPARAITALAISKENRCPLPIACSSNKHGKHYIYMLGTNEVLNSNIPTEKLKQTIQNFASELEREYQRHLKDVLAEAEP
jgi:hypothetical protein